MGNIPPYDSSKYQASKSQFCDVYKQFAEIMKVAPKLASSFLLICITHNHIFFIFMVNVKLTVYCCP